MLTVLTQKTKAPRPSPAGSAQLGFPRLIQASAPNPACLVLAAGLQGLFSMLLMRVPLMHNTEQPAGPPSVPDKTVAFDPATAGWEPYRDEGFIGLVGPFWMRRSGDSYLYAFMAERKHHNRRGVVQGGMLMTFADRSMGMTCWYANNRKPQATIQLDVHFIESVQIGEFVEARCRVVRRTRSLIFMNAELLVGNRVVARRWAQIRVGP
jgi:acyl-coenzyme A thioesterase PaaI-like protein